MKLVLLLAAGCGRIGFDARGDAGDGTTGFAHSSLALATPGETLVDFPLLVTLDDQRADRTRLGDGSDLRFFDTTGAPLASGIERLAMPGGPPTIVWVRVPTIAAGTTITIAYGGATGPDNPSGVWAKEFAAVWHLATSDLANDAAGTHDATGTGTSIAGEIGVGRHLDGVTVPTAASTADIAPAAQTLTGWLNVPVLPQSGTYKALVSRQVADLSDNDIYLGLLGSQVVGTCEDNGTETDAQGGAVTANAWHHLASVASSQTISVYLDGASVGTTPVGHALTPSTDRPIFLGGDRSGASGSIDIATNDLLTADIDEVRIQTTARSAAWIAYDYLVESDRAITYGPVEN